jgi:hypothetical protein
VTLLLPILDIRSMACCDITKQLDCDPRPLVVKLLIEKQVQQNSSLLVHPRKSIHAIDYGSSKSADERHRQKKVAMVKTAPLRGASSIRNHEMAAMMVTNQVKERARKISGMLLSIKNKNIIILRSSILCGKQEPTRTTPSTAPTGGE